MIHFSGVTPGINLSQIVDVQEGQPKSAVTEWILRPKMWLESRTVCVLSCAGGGGHYGFRVVGFIFNN